MKGTYFLISFILAMEALAIFKVFKRQKDYVAGGFFCQSSNRCFNMNCSITQNYQTERTEILCNYIDLLLEKHDPQLFA